MSELRSPRTDLAIDLDRAIGRLPPGATIKGMFVNHVAEQAATLEVPARLYERAGTSSPRYLAFRDYPYSDLLRVVVRVAAVRYPDRPLAAAAREIGKGFYACFADSMAGRVMFGVLGRDARRVMPMGYRGWQVCVGFGDVRCETIGEDAVRYVFRHFPGLVETLDLGVIEGALDYCGERGDLRVADDDGRHWIVEVRW